MKTEIGLIYMPFADSTYPSLGLSLLKSRLANKGIAARIHYLNLWFAEKVDRQLFEEIVMGAPRTFDLAGEWIFSRALSGEDEQSDSKYIDQVLLGNSDAHHVPPTSFNQNLIDKIIECRQSVEPFLQKCLDEVPWSQYRLVGFSSTFQQQLAALALAKRVKELYPHLFVIFGGANVQGVMGEAVIENFPFVDAVCTGEGDYAFPELAAKVLAGKSLSKISGIIHRKSSCAAEKSNITENVQIQNSSNVNHLNELPYPNFDDFFADLKLTDLDYSAEQLKLVFETSRGCWWGAKSHCTFCGLNAASMAYRSKSSARAIDELLFLLEKYGQHTRSIIAVDNILPSDYFKTFLPQLKQLNLNLDLFYETKANLSEETVKLFSEVGLKTIQPGIESLSTPVLRLMKKGVTALQNIQLLKLCRQYNLQPIWNFLTGFPNEKSDYYVGLDSLVDSLTHLPPPNGVAKVRFDRFSPYFDKHIEFEVQNLLPYPSYRYLYPGLNTSALNDLAYYFVGDFEGKDFVDEYTKPLKESVENWKLKHLESNLFELNIGDELVIFDTRPTASQRVINLFGDQRFIYQLCSRIVSKTSLLKSYSLHLNRMVSEDELGDTLEPLLKNKILINEGSNYLNISILLN